MPIGKIVNLKSRAQVLNHSYAVVDIDGHEYEMGREVGSDKPMVIDWERRRAWVGTWGELLANIAEILEEEPEDATQEST